MRRWLSLSLLVFVAPLAAATDADDVAAYRALGAMDLRLASIGYRLVTANAPFCSETRPDPGWVLHDIAQYPDEEVARRAFLFWGPIAVAAVVPDGAADRAGLRAGDAVNGIDDILWQFDNSKLKKPDYRRMEIVKGQVEQALAKSLRPVVHYERKATAGAVELKPVKACRSGFDVDPSAKRDAGADGDRVRVTSAIIDYTPDDAELAAVVAHELAHNLLDHRAKLAKVKKGKIAAIRATEEEADRLSVWLMANAGFDPQAAISFWHRYGKATGLGIFSAPTHYRWKTRVKMLDEEIAALSRVPAENGLRRPPLLAKAGNQQ